MCLFFRCFQVESLKQQPDEEKEVKEKAERRQTEEELGEERKMRQKDNRSVQEAADMVEMSKLNIR